MKKLLFILFVLVYYQFYSQSYIPMLQEDNIWSVDVYYGILPPCDPTPCQYTVTPQISLGDIETIGGLDYIRVISDGSNTCLLREDNGFVYRYDEDNQIDKLLFDFTLGLDDVFEIEGSAYECCEACVNQVHGFGGGDLTVIGVDFLELAGEMRKVITFDEMGWWGNFQWIEGIGNITGFDFMWEQIDITDGSLLVCFETQGISYFFNNATSCDNTTFGIDDFNQDQMVLYPSPVQDILGIENTSYINIISIKIYDVLGRPVLVEKGNVNQVYVSHLNTGVLFVEIETVQGSITKKIIKE